MKKFRIFKQVPRIIFGPNSLDRISELLPDRKSNSDYYVFIIDDVFKAKKIEVRLSVKKNDFIEWFPASLKEPTTDQVDFLSEKVNETYQGKLPIAVIGIGGGSTMDVAKALSVLLCNDGSSTKYQGWDLVEKPGIYKIGVPTISGSGSEASRTAVLMGPERKFGINSDYSMFDAIILDSHLIKTVPLDQRFFSGMDCFIHCVESLEGTMINELARGYAQKALEHCKEIFSGNNNDDKLITASYMGGVSIVNSEVGICHALSYGLSIELGLRHGYANCIVFNSLEEYYKEHVLFFKNILKTNNIILPRGVCKNLSLEALNRMIDMTLKMERPLINALGKNWQNILTREKIMKLYRSM